MNTIVRKRPIGTVNESHVFVGEMPRAGKWTADEEHFANQLISQFEAGTLIDCEEGWTLRAYLSKRLNCQPMRISKKFAGKCIGKVSWRIYFFDRLLPQYNYIFP